MFFGCLHLKHYTVYTLTATITINTTITLSLCSRFHSFILTFVAVVPCVTVTALFNRGGLNPDENTYRELMIVTCSSSGNDDNNNSKENSTDDL